MTWARAEERKRLLKEDGLEEGGFFGEAGEKSGTVQRTATAITQITVKQGKRKRLVRGKTGENKGSEHLLIAQIGLNLPVSRSARLRRTTETVKAYGSDLRREIRVLQQQLGIKRRRPHLLTMERLGRTPMVGLVLITISGFVHAKEFALGDIGVPAKHLAGSGLDRVLVLCFRHSCIGF